MKIVCLYDRKAETAQSVIAVRSTDEAIRMFRDLVESGETIISKHPEDFCLYEIADWLPDTMRLDPNAVALLIAEACSFRTINSAERGQCEDASEKEKI